MFVFLASLNHFAESEQIYLRASIIFLYVLDYDNRYSADFGQDKDILKWILNYLDATKSGLLTHLLNDGGPVNIVYQNFDWSLNCWVYAITRSAYSKLQENEVCWAFWKWQFTWEYVKRATLERIGYRNMVREFSVYKSIMFVAGLPLDGSKEKLLVYWSYLMGTTSCSVPLNKQWSRARRMRCGL